MEAVTFLPTPPENFIYPKSTPGGRSFRPEQEHHHHRNNRQVHPFCSAAASVAKRSKTYLKINVAVFVHVERPEDVVAEFFGISRREEHFVHIYEFRRRQLAVWTILLQR